MKKQAIKALFGMTMLAVAFDVMSAEITHLDDLRDYTYRDLDINKDGLLDYLDKLADENSLPNNISRGSMLCGEEENVDDRWISPALVHWGTKSGLEEQTCSTKLATLIDEVIKPELEKMNAATGKYTLSDYKNMKLYSEFLALPDYAYHQMKFYHLLSKEKRAGLINRQLSLFIPSCYQAKDNEDYLSNKDLREIKKVCDRKISALIDQILEG
ncbi:hypothetical protein HPC38_09215 [Pasteurellaceae bacterium HPA106]|uniref:hypothetical protein n=1 Tax=Spirabiliibacterium pneumoniae TaxID=221400 RepID=UPI001AAD003E|nr:hypothetical protein [Spirabiliibacterium pneumoniae]MBE2897048.1 hypothetical protein [Spirabiliibacterium pneumoniae]